jgi:hypothetical protein
MVDPALPDAALLAGHPDVHVDPDPGLVLLAPDGPSGAPVPHGIGPATVDSDADGRADTAVVAEPDVLVLATDVDGDAHVDVVTTLGADGGALTRAVPDWDEGVPPPAPTIDPVTGLWVRGG